MNDLPPGFPIAPVSKVRCAYTGLERPEAEMIRMGDVWLAPEHKDSAVAFLQQGGVFPTHRRWPMPGFGALCGHGSRLFVRSWKVLLLIHMFLFFPLFLWGRYIAEHPLSGGFMSPPLAIFIIYGLVGAIGSAAIIHKLSKTWSGEQVEVFAALGAVRRKFIGVMILNVPGSIAMMAGTWILILPTILAAKVVFFIMMMVFFIPTVLLTFSVLFLVEGRHRFFGSIKAGFVLLKGSFWRVVGYNVLLCVVTLGIYGVVEHMVEASPGLHWWPVRAFLDWIVSAPSLWWMALFFALYKALLDEPAKMQDFKTEDRRQKTEDRRQKT